MIRTTKKNLVSGILAFSLLTSSFGGAFTPIAFADTPEETASEEAVHSSKTDKGILAGLAAVGLLAVLTNKGGSGDSSASKNTVPSTPKPTQPNSTTQSPTKPTTTQTKPQTTTTTVSASDEQKALSLLNQDRAKSGLAALKANSSLTSLARSYAQDMIKRGYFSHYNPEGQSPFDRMSKAGISYKTAGENLAINTSVAGAETAFMNSTGHRANILNTSYTEVGIGVVRTSGGQVYVVQEFIGK